MKAFPYRSLRSGLIMIISLFAGIGIIALTQNFSLGRLAYLSSPVLFLAVVLTLFIVNVKSGISVRRFDAGLSLRQVSVIAPLAACCAWLVIRYISDFSVTYTLAGLMVIAGVGLACFLTLTQDNVYGLGIFLLTLPMLFFLEWELNETWFGGKVIGPFLLKPSLLLILLFSGISLISAGLRRVRLHDTPVVKYLYGFFFFAIIATCFAGEPQKSAWELWGMAIVSSLFLVVISRVRSQRDILICAAGLVLYTIMRIGIGIYLFGRAGEIDFTTTLYYLSYRKALFDINILSITAAWMIPLALGGFIIGSYKRAVWLQVVSVSAVLILAFFTLLSGKIAAILALFLTFPAIFLYPGPYRRTMATLVAAILAVAVLYIAFLNPEVLLHRISPYTSIAAFLELQAERLDAWRSSLEMIRDFPFGIGFGGFRAKILNYTRLTPYFSMGFGTLGDPHHFFLYYATSAGLGALICLVAIIVKSTHYALVVILKSSDVINRVTGVSLLWGFATYIVIGFMGPGAYYLVYLPKDFATDEMIRFMLLDTGILFWLTSGLLYGLYRLECTREGQRVEIGQT